MNILYNLKKVAENHKWLNKMEAMLLQNVLNDIFHDPFSAVSVE